MRYGSVCSGIEAASVAWHPLGWQPAWFSEIEPFPAAVLAHHWPDVPNLGDMLTLPDRVAAGEVEAPDVLVGGTPCQAFSVAGRRGSLLDERGALSLAYVELANRIDEVRHARREDPVIIVWENVPGVLSTKDNAFGCFLAGLAGEAEPLQPTGPRWANAGCVSGPQRTVVWRVLDAQHFGVAQRRRRVFLVASARADFDPAEVLFEREGVRRDSAPRREARQDLAAPAGGGAPGAVPARGCFWDGGQVTQTLDAVLHKGQTMPEKNRFPAVIQPTGFANRGHFGQLSETVVGDPLRAKGGDTGHGGETLVCAVTGDITHALNSANNGKGCSEDGTGRGVPTICFVQNSRSEVRQVGGDGQITGAIAAAPGVQQQHYVAQSVALRGREGGGTAEISGDVATALRASSGGGDKPHVLTNTADTLTSNWHKGSGALAGKAAGVLNPVFHGVAVRRLMPVECERLQGFPDGHTDIPAWYACRCGHAFPEDLGKYGCPNCCGENTARLKTVADGPRYRAIGNSMAVPCMAWIGTRIQQEVEFVDFELCLA